MSYERLLVSVEGEVPVPVVVVGVEDVLRRVVQDSLHVSHGVAVVQHGGCQPLTSLKEK